jgi:protein ImuA
MAAVKGFAREADIGAPADSAALLSLGAPLFDAALGGGLALGQLHELAPSSSFHTGAATGFALGLAVLNQRPVVWVQQDFAALEAGAPYGLGCELFGLSPSNLLLVRAAKPEDALFAMEESLKARVTVIGELAEEGRAADLTATRRLSLAAQKGRVGLALLLRHRTQSSPSASATRWEVSGALGRCDGMNGLSPTSFRLTLLKNRRGPCGQWVLQWDHHEHRFKPALSLDMAAPAFDRPAARARAG